MKIVVRNYIRSFAGRFENLLLPKTVFCFWLTTIRTTVKIVDKTKCVLLTMRLLIMEQLKDI